jgi:hypothetical protein
MRKIIAFIFLLTSAGALAQNDLLKDTVVQPIITELGKPDGAKVEMQIGKDGGSLKSSDGKVELIFPAGALKENTNIVIQPVTNLVPNGSGKAYWFEPSGIQFKKPVQIIINYTDEEAEICPPDLMGLAIQNKQGQWSFINYDSWDSTAKLLKGSITHFSGATNVNKWMILPFYSRIKVRSKIELTLSDISSFFEPGYDDHAKPKFPWVDLHRNETVLWYANDHLNGSSLHGYITPEFGVLATYEAPSHLPVENPVTVKAEVYIIKKDRTGQTLTLIRALTSKIHIYAEYGFRIVYQTDQPDPGGTFGTMSSKDTSLLGVRFDGKHAEIIWKINKNTSTGLYFKQGKCILTTETPGSGLLHISGMMGQLIRPAKSYREPAIVEILFTKELVVMPLINYDCTAILGGRIGNSAKAKAFADKFIRALPVKLIFKAEEYEGREVIETFGKEGTPIFYKVEIWQIKDD